MQAVEGGLHPQNAIYTDLDSEGVSISLDTDMIDEDEFMALQGDPDDQEDEGVRTISCL